MSEGCPTDDQITESPINPPLNAMQMIEATSQDEMDVENDLNERNTEWNHSVQLQDTPLIHQLTTKLEQSRKSLAINADAHHRLRVANEEYKEMIENLQQEIANLKSNSLWNSQDLPDDGQWIKLPRSPDLSQSTADLLSHRTFIIEYDSQIMAELNSRVSCLSHDECKQQVHKKDAQIRKMQVDLRELEQQKQSAAARHQRDLDDHIRERDANYVAMTCVICKTAVREIASIGCGHLTTCRSCWLRQDRNECPICRAPAISPYQFQNYSRNGFPVNLR